MGKGLRGLVIKSVFAIKVGELKEWDLDAVRSDRKMKSALWQHLSVYKWSFLMSIRSDCTGLVHSVRGECNCRTESKAA